MNVNNSQILGNQSDMIEALNYYLYKPQDNPQFFQGTSYSVYY